MWILYTIETIVILAFIALILGGLYKMITYPQKLVVDKTGRSKWVDDNEYHYKEKELMLSSNIKWTKHY